MSTLLAAYGVSHFFDRYQVLSEVSFELHHGRILALLGPNGSGKTTLLKLICGIYNLKRSRDSGIIRITGHEIREFSSREIAKLVAYVNSDLFVEFPLTVFEAALLGRSCHGTGWLSLKSARDESVVEQALKSCFCWDLRDQLVASLSAGQRQLVALAQALAKEPKALLLDETLASMDLDHQWKIGGLLSQLAADGMGIILVAHDINLATEWAQDCLFLKKGQVAGHGPTRDVITAERVSSLYPDGEFVVAPNPATGAPKVFFGGCVKP